MRRTEYLASKHDLKNLTLLLTGFQLTRAMSGALVHNLAAVGALTAKLPLDAEPGERFIYTTAAAQSLVADPGAAGTIQVGATVGTAGQKSANATAGNWIEYTCVGAGPAWLATRYVGTFTVS